MTERSVPHNDHAEAATLGAILIDRDALVPIAAWLQPDHFYDAKHAAIYEAMLHLYNQRTPPDLTTLADELKRRDKLEAVGGVPYLISLTDSVPTAAHVEFYARSVERTAVLRRLIQAGGTIAAMGFEDGDDVDALIAQAEGELQRILQARQAQNKYVTLSSAIDATYHRIDAIKQGTYKHGIRTRLHDLDDLIGGLGRGNMSIVAARPGVGKSAYVTTLAYNIGFLSRIPVGIVSLEMNHEEISDRLCAIHTGLDGEAIKRGELDDQQLVTLMDGMGQISDAPIYIDDSASLNVAELRAKVRQMHTETGIEVLIIDYLQLLDGDRGRRQDSETQEVGYISKQLVQLARELNIHIIAVSQLSRAVEHRTDRRPILSDLRASGQIEQDAYLIMFLYRDEMVNKDSEEKGVAEVIVAKHRGGKIGTVKLAYQAHATRFLSLARYENVEGY